MAMRQINLRLDEDEIAAIDRERGLIPREAWLRSLIALGQLHAGSLRTPRGVASELGVASETAQVSRGNAPATPSLNRADAFRQSTQGKRKR